MEDSLLASVPEYCVDPDLSSASSTARRSSLFEVRASSLT
jgi:hypothetical protein